MSEDVLRVMTASGPLRPICGASIWHKGVAVVQEPKEKGGKPVSDQQLPAFVVADSNGKAVGPVQDGDAVIIFNFRADRVVEISKALEYEKFDKFERKRFPKVCGCI